jgi:hypothetical protein
MQYSNKAVNQKVSNNYRSLIATSLLISGIFQFIAPVLAEGTAAGASISNTATATYEDPIDKTPLNATSNTVVVTVAEVAGITVTASGVTDETPNDPVKISDKLYFNYTVTNVGNDPTKFRVPDLAKVTGPGQAGKLEYSKDGGQTWTPIPGGEVITDPIAVGGSILVRVPVTVTQGAQDNDIINVTLGDTPGDAQNQKRDRNDGGDVYTVDVAGLSGIDKNPADGKDDEVTGDPVNGTREASATQKATVNQSTKSFSLATILKNRTDYSGNGTDKINDDKLGYELSLRVELTDPTGNKITPAPLVGTPIKMGNNIENHILVSDAIPKDTLLDSMPTPPPGWMAVYTLDDPTAKTALESTWLPLTASVDLTTVKRIGYVNDPVVITSIAPGKTITGFKVPLRVNSATVPDTAPSLMVANIAQVFGQAPGGTTVVYDESGDNRPSNYGDNGSLPPGSVDVNGDGIPDATPPIDKGYPDPTKVPPADADIGNNNSGTGEAGEPNLYEIKKPVASDLLNGPDRAPDATGPKDNNDDFTNKSALVPTDKSAPGSMLDPAPVGFTNTVKNSGTSENDISLVPTPPANPTDLKPGTLVTITYDNQSKSYVWTGTEFKYDADKNPATTNDQTPIDDKSEYITIPKVQPGQSINYGVEVNLPPDSPLSTDIDKGFPVPITAFIDDATPGLGSDPVKEARNITIDRVYTGFLKLRKESRVLPGSGTAVKAGDETWSDKPKSPAPGNIIEYRIKYKNISEAQAGTKNVILEADKVVIVEDGTLSTAAGDGKNNWALDNDINGQLDTSNIIGTAKDSGASTIQFYSGKPGSNLAIDQTGTTVNTDVTKYVNSVQGKVQPGEERYFMFQRKVN